MITSIKLAQLSINVLYYVSLKLRNYKNIINDFL